MPKRSDLPVCGNKRRQQLVRLRTVVGAGGFQQGDGFGDGAALGCGFTADHLFEKIQTQFSKQQTTQSAQTRGYCW